MFSLLEDRSALLRDEETLFSVDGFSGAHRILRAGTIPTERGFRRRVALFASLSAEGSGLAAICAHSVPKASTRLALRLWFSSDCERIGSMLKLRNPHKNWAWDVFLYSASGNRVTAHQLHVLPRDGRDGQAPARACRKKEGRFRCGAAVYGPMHWVSRR